MAENGATRSGAFLSRLPVGENRLLFRRPSAVRATGCMLESNMSTRVLGQNPESQKVTVVEQALVNRG